MGRKPRNRTCIGLIRVPAWRWYEHRNQTATNTWAVAGRVAARQDQDPESDRRGDATVAAPPDLRQDRPPALARDRRLRRSPWHRSHAASEYLDIASEVLREREGIPGGRADELLEVLERLGAAVDILGPPAFGILRLLAHWASQGGGLKVNEDELVAEIRGVGADEWEQAIVAAELGLRELEIDGPSEG